MIYGVPVKARELRPHQIVLGGIEGWPPFEVRSGGVALKWAPGVEKKPELALKATFYTSLGLSPLWLDADFEVTVDHVDPPGDQPAPPQDQENPPA